MHFTKSRTTAVVAGAAVLALAGGGTVAIADQLIGSADIRNGSIRSIDVKNGALGMRDLNDFTKNRINQPGPAGEDGRDGADGKDGAQGPAGPQGPQGAPGPAATVGISHWSEAGTIPAGGTAVVQANCQQDGHLAIGGGFSNDTNDANNDKVVVFMSRNTAAAPNDPKYAEGWIIRAKNNDTKPRVVRAWVVCANVVEDEPAPTS